MLSFFYLTHKFLGYASIGCYRRIHSKKGPGVFLINNVADCVQACGWSGFKFVGLQVSKYIQQYFMEIFDHL